MHCGIEPLVGVGDELRMRREALAQVEPEVFGGRREVVEVRPGALRVDVVGSQGGDPAPVVCSGAHEECELGRVGEVRRHLHPHPGAQHQAGGGDRGDVLEKVGVGCRLHGSAGLGAEVLHDHLLHVTVAGMGVAQGDERLRPVAHGLADADEDAGGERDAGTPGILDHAQSHVGVFVGGSVVHLPGLFVEAAGGGFEHHAHGGGGGAERAELVGGHHTGVQVREHAGLGGDEVGDVGDVVEGGGEAVVVEPRACFRPALFGAVAEGEQGFLASECRALAHDREHLLVAHEHGLALLQELAGGVDEDAVVASVATEGRERHEHLARVGDHA